MSLILEALRKSEIERRRAQTPDLYAEPAVATRPPLTASPRWLTWALAAVAALLLTGWLARGLWSTPTPPVDAHASTRVDSTTPAPAANPTPASSVAPTVAETAVAAPAFGDSVAPPASVAPPPRPIELPTTVTTPGTTAPLPLPASVATSAPSSIPMPTPIPAAAPPTPIGDAPLRLADLSHEERQQLPTLKMSMHLWDPASAQRFVILDGERMGEGDRVGDAVIDEITRDGVVLAWQGRRLKLPIQ